MHYAVGSVRILIYYEIIIFVPLLEIQRRILRAVLRASGSVPDPDRRPEHAGVRALPQPDVPSRQSFHSPTVRASRRCFTSRRRTFKARAAGRLPAQRDRADLLARK